MWVDVRRELWIAVYNIKKNQWKNGNDVYDFEYFYEQLERHKEWEMEEQKQKDKLIEELENRKRQEAYRMEQEKLYRAEQLEKKEKNKLIEQQEKEKEAEELAQFIAKRELWARMKQQEMEERGAAELDMPKINK